MRKKYLIPKEKLFKFPFIDYHMSEEYLIPLYKGNETEYEDIIYSFFRRLGEDFNFIFKVKKTNTKIDEILYSRKGG